VHEQAEPDSRFTAFARDTKLALCRAAAALASNLREALAGSSSRGFHIEAIVHVYVFNVLLMALVGRGYLVAVPEGTSVRGWAFALVALASNSAMLCLVALAVLAPPAILARRWWVTLVMVPCTYALLNGLLYADTIVYRLFRMHFNGMILNVLITPGAGDSVTAGVGTWVSSVTIVAALFAAELGLALCGFPWLRRRGFASRIRSGKSLGVAAAIVFALILTDKTLFAIGDLRDDIEITRSRTIFPLYQPVTIRTFARDTLGMDISADNRARFEAMKGSMDYPKAPVTFDPAGARPNVLLVGLEGGRFDALAPDVMPFLHRWGERNLIFEEHYSAGNCSRFGLFGLLHGIHGTYWHRALAERCSSVLVDSLGELGYEFRILSCTNLEFPEFRKTSFVNVQKAITDEWDCERVERDEAMTDEFLLFLDEREEERPFFAFMFYDASHQPYLYPPEHAVFETEARPDNLDYVKVARDLSLATPFRERFKNSLHYIDSHLERALRALEVRGLMDDTLVFIAGDHGEEFCELGLFGHNSTFHRYQAKTVMVARIPGEAPRRVKRLTSHVDVVPTVFAYMGVRNPVQDYAQGTPLTSAEGPDYVLVAGWDEAAIVDAQTITRFGLETYNAGIAVTDHDYRLLPDQRAARTERAERLREVLGEMCRFVK
jgi:membrane-anchored protein YejM (alkaline phosphatase superfamily)